MSRRRLFGLRSPHHHTHPHTHTLTHTHIHAYREAKKIYKSGNPPNRRIKPLTEIISDYLILGSKETRRNTLRQANPLAASMYGLLDYNAGILPTHPPPPQQPPQPPHPSALRPSRAQPPSAPAPALAPAPAPALGLLDFPYTHEAVHMHQHPHPQLIPMNAVGGGPAIIASQQGQQQRPELSAAARATPSRHAQRKRAPKKRRKLQEDFALINHNNMSNFPQQQFETQHLPHPPTHVGVGDVLGATVFDTMHGFNFTATGNGEDSFLEFPDFLNWSVNAAAVAELATVPEEELMQRDDIKKLSDRLAETINKQQNNHNYTQGDADHMLPEDPQHQQHQQQPDYCDVSLMLMNDPEAAGCLRRFVDPMSNEQLQQQQQRRYQGVGDKGEEGGGGPGGIPNSGGNNDKRNEKRNGGEGEKSRPVSPLGQGRQGKRSLDANTRRSTGEGHCLGLWWMPSKTRKERARRQQTRRRPDKHYATTITRCANGTPGASMTSAGLMQRSSGNSSRSTWHLVTSPHMHTRSPSRTRTARTPPSYA